VWVEVTAAPFRFDAEPGAQVIVRDISERIAARAARHRLEAERGELLERLQLVLERMPAACVVNDTSFRITYWNAAAQRTFGYTFEEVKGRHPFGLITPPVAQPAVDEIFRALERSPEPVAATNVNVTKDGRTITCAWVNSALRDRAGRFIGVISMAQDVTAELRARDALRDTAEMLAQAQQIAHLGSWDLDLASGDVQWSDEMYRIFGQDRATFRTTRDAIHAFLHPDDRDRVIRAADESYATDAPFNIDHRVVRPDGTVRHVNSQGKVIRDRSGKAQRFIGTMLDITQRKLAEDELRRLNETLEQRVAERTAELRQANEDLEAFGYTIAHDLRAPMRAMRGFAQALLEDYAPALGETGLEYARRVVAGAARVERLTEDLLAYSRLAQRDLVPERVSLVLVLHEVIGQLQRDPQFARVHVEVVEPMPWVLAHRPTLAAVVSNLLENAAKFVAPGVDPVIAVRAEDRGDAARVWFLDNGIGIDPEHHERIFHVFERLHGMEQFSGTGIGLPIVRRGVERMGGRVGVESALGAGSRFWIELPKDPQSP
jgi:PAS domain S-box-containing protein